MCGVTPGERASRAVTNVHVAVPIAARLARLTPPVRRGSGSHGYYHPYRGVAGVRSHIRCAYSRVCCVLCCCCRGCRSQVPCIPRARHLAPTARSRRDAAWPGCCEGLCAPTCFPVVKLTRPCLVGPLPLLCGCCVCASQTRRTPHPALRTSTKAPVTKRWCVGVSGA